MNSFVRAKLLDLIYLIETQEENNADRATAKTIDNEFENVEEIIYRRKNITKSRQKIAVIFPDNTRISHKQVVDTIEKIGPEKIIPLNIYRCVDVATL